MARLAAVHAMHKLAVNAHRLRQPTAKAIVDHALDSGIRTFDVLGSQQASTRLVLEAIAHRTARIIAKIGYFELSEATKDFVSDGGRQLSEAIGYSLTPKFVEAEMAQLIDVAAGTRLDVLLHHPELSENPRAALETLAGMRRAGAPIDAIGWATNAIGFVESKSASDGATIARVPTSALFDDTTVETISRLAQRFEVVGHRPLLQVTGEGQRRLVDQDLATDAATVQQEYIQASERALAHFTPPDDLHDEETRQGCAWIQQLIADLNANVTSFTSLEMWESEIAAQIIPMLHNKFSQLDEDSADHLQAFFRAYGQVVRWLATDSTRQLCVDLQPGQPMADWALERVFRGLSPNLACLSVAFQSTADLDRACEVVRRVFRESSPS